MSNPVGRPPKFKSPEELTALFEKYMADDDFDDYKSISGFCVYAGTNRFYLAELEGDKPEFSHSIKEIREAIARFCIKHGQKSEKNQALNIFLLKNYGYTDKTEQDITVKGNISIDQLFDKIDESDKIDENG